MVMMPASLSTMCAMWLGLIYEIQWNEEMNILFLSRRLFFFKVTKRRSA